MKPSSHFTTISTPLPSEGLGEASIGIFGGSFNPIHNGHIALAKAFLEKENLNEVWFFVSPQNPFKVNQQLLADHLRLELVRKAIADNPHFRASDYEFQLPKPSYTWNTLQHLSHNYPTHRFTLLVGGDNWAAFDRWYHAEDILSNYKIVVYPRRGQEIDKSTLPTNVSLLQTPLIDVSSTDVRQRVEQGEDISKLVPEEILNDIQRLY
ncbi:nicotinate-nucleotide adenylyltransferase [Prevotella melaninogenica]|uniref:nicotinate (nicotinamide) nucleotide adenylyltransferase n=1 Tax=Prevotella TaxID=838 RepID=UPI0003AD52E9|nr:MULTISPECIES: nicotinate (nicotinamide) nucleotide adenylyltransferase [Prevotella]ERJ77191.1 nicotinate-nucleotide adenylyltransferase [Prevotella sp. F0091]QUB74472.1 nicotinate-nucleotide adenylyltransferase [Prevotella melaninogenica]